MKKFTETLRLEGERLSRKHTAVLKTLYKPKSKMFYPRPG